MKPVKVNAFDIRNGFAAGARTAFGALCTRSADGIAKPIATGTTVSDYIGVAPEDMVTKTVEGFYSQYDTLPLISAGVVHVWLLGGETIDSGNYLKAPTTLGAGTEPLGVLVPEGTATTRTTKSLAKCVGPDVGDADYDQTVSSISEKVLTIDSAAHLTALSLAKGDYVVIDSDEAAEVNRIDNPAVSTTTCSVQLDPSASHATNIKIYKLVQAEVLLL